MSDWVDLELAENLAPVQAPPELWNRVASWADRPVRSMGARFLPAAVPIAAVVTLVLAGALWFMARGETAQSTYRQIPVSARAESCVLCHMTL